MLDIGVADNSHPLFYLSFTKRHYQTSFWQKLFGSTPKRKAFNRKHANELAEILSFQVKDLKDLLYSSDSIETNRTTKYSENAMDKGELSFQVKSEPFTLSGSAGDSRSVSQDAEVKETFSKSKIHFLHQNILEYQKIFHKISDLSDGDSYLFLDDLYSVS